MLSFGSARQGAVLLVKFVDVVRQDSGNVVICQDLAKHLHAHLAQSACWRGRHVRKACWTCGLLHAKILSQFSHVHHEGALFKVPNSSRKAI